VCVGNIISPKSVRSGHFVGGTTLVEKDLHHPNTFGDWMKVP
jgi:hypothetical protein